MRIDEEFQVCPDCRTRYHVSRQHFCMPPIVALDRGLVLEAINVGLLVIAELSKDGVFWKKRGANGSAMSFSHTVLGEAGGIEKFMAEWERML